MFKDIDLYVAVLLAPSYICLFFILRRFISYGNGYIKGFNAAKKLYESHKKEKNFAVYTDDISKAIQQKIDALKEQTDGNDD